MRTYNKRRWWVSDPEERFWLESTDRADIGSDLKFPTVDDGGNINWRYTLFLESQPGDVVFHYRKGTGIVGWSNIAGEAVQDTIIWGARGSYAREKGTVPYQRPGWVIPLENFTQLARPISIMALQAAAPRLREVLQQVQNLHPKQALYFPLEFSGKRDSRILQGYAFKVPKAIVDELPFGAGVEPRGRRPRNSANGSQGFGTSAAANTVVERHAMDRATAFFEARGYKVNDDSATRPYDLAISRGVEALTVEVKGTTSTGERVILTRNEVDHVRCHPGICGLFIVRNIQLLQADGLLSAHGGDDHFVLPWTIEDKDLRPISYFYRCGRPR